MSLPQAFDARALVAALPQTETHLHIEGALPFRLLQSTDPAAFCSPPVSWNDNYRYPTFQAFEADLIGKAMHWYTSPERYHEAARAIFTELRDGQKVRYLETSFASGVMEFGGLPAREVAQAILAAVPEGLTVRLFLGIHHSGYNARTQRWIDDCLSWPEVAGLDLHGLEDEPIGDWAPRLWTAARAAGKFTKAHAGEFCGPDFVRYALDELGVDRLEHGVRSAEDPALLAEMARRGVTCDVCPISNVKLRVAPSLEAHQLRALIDAGVRCTLSTDDPMIFGSTLLDEYLAVQQALGLSAADLVQLARNGFAIALVEEPQRQAWLEELEAAAAPFLECQ